jgi:hypothetical protein
MNINKAKIYGVEVDKFPKLAEFKNEYNKMFKKGKASKAHHKKQTRTNNDSPNMENSREKSTLMANSTLPMIPPTII